MKTTLEIQNLKCGGCAYTISSKLNDLNQISEVEIDNEKCLVTFSYKTESNLIEAKALLEKLGYPEVGDKNTITTKAKSFVSCAIGRINN